jgi:hypothetical protein
LDLLQIPYPSAREATSCADPRKARDPERRALPDHGHSACGTIIARRSQTGDGGLPGKKTRWTCNWPIVRCRSSITFRASSTAGALLHALCCFLSTPTSHAALGRSALSPSDGPENRAAAGLAGAGRAATRCVSSIFTLAIHIEVAR